jgi:hypothetical protein
MARSKKNRSKKESFLNRVDPPQLPILGVSQKEMDAIIPRMDHDLKLLVSMACASGNREYAQDIFLTACGVMYVRSLETMGQKLTEELIENFNNPKLEDYILECLTMFEELSDVIASAQAMGFMIEMPVLPEFINEQVHPQYSSEGLKT